MDVQVVARAQGEPAPDREPPVALHEAGEAGIDHVVGVQVRRSSP